MNEHNEDKNQLGRIERKLDRLLEGQRKMAGTEAEILQELSDANDETNAIGVELQQLLDSQGIPQSVIDAGAALVTRLKAVASQTPTPPAPPAPPAP